MKFLHSIKKTLLLSACFVLLHPDSVLFSQSLRGDSTRGKFGMELNSTYGFVIAHRSTMAILQERHTYGFELSFIKPADGSKSFHETFLYPDVGWTIAWFNLGNPEKLGSGIALYPFVNFPLHIKDDWRFHFRYGMGLGYIEKVFHEKENPKNAAIGTHLNGVMHFDFHIEKEIGERTVIELGAGITHYSNGSSGIPNLGINIASANFGIMHYFGEKSPVLKSSTEKIRRTTEIQTSIAGAFKKIYPPLGKTYYGATISATYLMPVKRKSSLGMGVDFFYDESLEERIRRDSNMDNSRGDNYRAGIYGAYEVRLGHIGMLINMGVYPYTKYKKDGNFYHRIGSRYYFEKFFLMLNLKTHFAKADLIEWGIGYRIIENTKSK